jgi:hypothetical protein
MTLLHIQRASVALKGAQNNVDDPEGASEGRGRISWHLAA